MVLGKLSVLGRPIAVAGGAGWVCLDIFSLVSLSFLLSFSLFGRRSDID